MMLRETKPVPWRLNPAETEQNNNFLQQEIARLRTGRCRCIVGWHFLTIFNQSKHKNQQHRKKKKLLTI